MYFCRNKSDPDRRFNFDPFLNVERDHDFTDTRCGDGRKVYEVDQLCHDDFVQLLTGVYKAGCRIWSVSPSIRVFQVHDCIQGVSPLSHG